MSLRSLLGPLLTLLLLFSTAVAHRIDVEPGQKECFHEMLQPNDKMTITYQVGEATGGGYLDIDFFVKDATGKTFYTDFKKPEGTFSMQAPAAGKYSYCFSNEMSTYSRKVLSFNVHGVMFMGDDEHIAPVEQEIRDLSSGLQLVKDEQAYLVVRERVHRNTAESTNARVKWWAIAQTIILLGVCGWNVHYLKSWFEVKRVL